MSVVVGRRDVTTEHVETPPVGDERERQERYLRQSYLHQIIDVLLCDTLNAATHVVQTRYDTSSGGGLVHHQFTMVIPYCPLKYHGLSWCIMVVVKATMTNHGSIYNYHGTPWLQNILPYSFPPWHHGKNGFRNSKLYFT